MECKCCVCGEPFDTIDFSPLCNECKKNAIHIECPDCKDKSRLGPLGRTGELSYQWHCYNCDRDFNANR